MLNKKKQKNSLHYILNIKTTKGQSFFYAV